MRIFVSSSFEDLREHRAAAIHVLRQLGHEVLAMEEMIAGAEAPLAKVLEMVDRSEAYVGIFAWRYGYIPSQATQPQVPQADGIALKNEAIDGKTSITHYEYKRALQRKLPVMAFLVDEHYPWPPQFIDGFDKTRPQAPKNADNIRSLRLSLQQERVVSWFTTPNDLEARVSAAVTMAGLTSQLDLQPAMALDPNTGTGVAENSFADIGIKNAIIDAGDHLHALKIDLATTWWSTRLYLIATLAQRITQVRRIIVVDTRTTTLLELAEASPSNLGQPIDERFIGQLSTSAIISTIGSKVPALRAFEEWLKLRSSEYSKVDTEIEEILKGWSDKFNEVEQHTHTNEEINKVDLTAELLRRWFGDAMLQQPLHIADMQRASAVDLLRLLDYPNDYVPVLTRQDPTIEGQPSTERVNIVDKDALNARLARNYLVELLDRARIV